MSAITDELLRLTKDGKLKWSKHDEFEMAATLALGVGIRVDDRGRVYRIPFKQAHILVADDGQDVYRAAIAQQEARKARTEELREQAEDERVEAAVVETLADIRAAHWEM